MQFIRFNTQQEAQDVCDRVFTDADADGKFSPGTTAYAIPENENYFIVPVLQGFESYFTQTELNGAEQFAEEKQGRTIQDDLKTQIAALTVADRATLINKLVSCVVAMQYGDLRAAKVIANNLTTDAVYTNARKTWLLNRIQTEIDLL